jgi:hypothetical protein
LFLKRSIAQWAVLDFHEGRLKLCITLSLGRDQGLLLFFSSPSFASEVLDCSKGFSAVFEQEAIDDLFKGVSTASDQQKVLLLFLCSHTSGCLTG